jgi:hypothetical protein
VDGGQAGPQASLVHNHIAWLRGISGERFLDDGFDGLDGVPAADRIPETCPEGFDDDVGIDLAMVSAG